MLKLLSDFDFIIREGRTKTNYYNNVKFKSFAAFMEALEREGLVQPKECIDGLPAGTLMLGEKKYYGWVDMVGSNKIKLLTQGSPYLQQNSTKHMIVKGEPAYLEIFESVLKRHSLFEGYVEETIKPKDVKVVINYHKKLNPSLWQEKDGKYQLIPKVETNLKKIANEFIEYLKLPKLEIVDLTITGSNANYNWTSYSDVDLHIIINFEKAKKHYGELLEDYLSAKRKLWDHTHDIKIYNNPVEVYIEKSSEKHISTGVYSIKNRKWIEEPQHKEPTYNENNIKEKTAKYMNEIDELYSASGCDSSYAGKLMDKLKTYRQAGLDRAGEFSTENLVFKTLRNSGYIEKLAQCKIKGIDAKLSIEDEEWWKY
jgi:predicted nucleotidyltransferase